MLNITKIIYFFSKLNYKYRRIIIISIDLIILFLSLYISFKILEINPNSYQLPKLYLLTALITILFYLSSSQYKGITRYLDSQEVYKLILWNIVIIFFINLLIGLIKFKNPSFNFWFLYFIISTFFTSGIKFIARDILIHNYIDQYSSNKKKRKEKIAIYGAGEAGISLLSSIKISNKYNVKFFVDDTKYLQRRSIKGVPIYDPSILESNRFNIDFILLAMPSESIERRRKIISKINKLGVKIMQIPSLEELSKGVVNIENFKSLNIEELLGRAPIIAQKDLIEESINEKYICITGGGGSIGSGISREICQYNFKKLIIIERSEPSIYKIEKEILGILQKNNKDLNKLICLLGDCTDEQFMENIFKKYSIDIVYHSAAYKHVPLVENNPISGIYNNIKSTYLICKLAKHHEIQKVVLISSDKAVRPTNIMGATKRLSEQIIQSFSEEFRTKINTKFTAVRFGNVLGSSGSVVPLFEKQIRDGGPITLTHKEIIRYFMTINEAAQLVIQASALSCGGEIFLLEMGKPILIRDLAIKMIRNFGLDVKDENNIDGDIEIKITGLRPGEKLYEELLIDGESIKTKCSGIYYVKEDHMKAKSLWFNIELLLKTLSKNDLENSLKILNLIVPEWKRKLK